MKIFYIDIKEFKKNHAEETISQYADKEFKSIKRFYEYCAGRYLVKNVAKTVYGIKDCQIVISDSGKPEFKNSNLCFSISHSKNYAVACFDTKKCGIDIEFMKTVRLDDFSNHYKRNFSNLEEFYKFWTMQEAEYKLGAKSNNSCSQILKSEYYLTVVSENEIDKNTEIIPYK